jgi:signal transduction histidine kinase
LSVNNKFEDIFNVFALDIIGENLVNAFPDWGRFVLDLARRKTSSENVVITHKANHIEITLSDIGIPLSETIGYFVMFKDVTEREQLQEKLAYYTQELEREVYKRTEELQLSNAELQKLGQLKNEYLSNVSHEMRTPLTTIKGFTETMLNRKVSSDQVKEFLNIIIEESHRLERIVNDILDITRIQQGIMLKQLVFNEFDLTEEVNRVLRILLPLIEEKNIRLSVKSDRNQIILHADRDRIRQVIINIVENAIKFSNQGGKIDITLKKDGKSVVFCCRDNGIGIPEDERGKVFEKFYMVDGSDRKLCRGTGVGLYIAREIVNLHNGTIKLDEKIKKGSRFIMILPERSDPGELNEKDTGNR